MHSEFLMGNAAIALGAIAAGVDLVAGYPGTPSRANLVPDRAGHQTFCLLFKAPVL